MYLKTIQFDAELKIVQKLFNSQTRLTMHFMPTNAFEFF